MVVVGQFNLGFILARLDQDVFIVDQHAADEKATFERLQARLVLNKQPLLLPKDLQLGPLDQAILRDHVEAFRRNGFEFVEPKANSGPAAQQPLEIDQGLEEQPGDGGGAEGHDGEGGAGGGGGTLAVQRPLHDQRPHWQQGLLLAAVPYSKGVVFGPDDVCEMVGLIKAGVRPEDVQPSRVRSMLASRACRSSIMIGTALDRRAMRSVLDNLAGLAAPWHCPHGRPTMRHVCVLQGP
ncbi:MutL C terminal dimerization domain-containing protein [Haematococcus lacustris]